MWKWKLNGNKNYGAKGIIMDPDASNQTGLKWTNIPTKYALIIIAVIIAIVFGSAIYGPYRWRVIAESVNMELKGKAAFTDVVAIPEAGVTIRGKVKTAGDLADLEVLVNASHTFPVIVNYRVTIGSEDPVDIQPPIRRK
jgi:hypothetical protein